MPDTRPEDPGQLVFSGDGLRCFWQGDFLSVLTRHRRLALSSRTATPTGRRVVNGGMADPDIGTTLIPLTRDCDTVPWIERRHYIAPSREPPADTIDLTDPVKLRATWAQGERDARDRLDLLPDDWSLGVRMLRCRA